MELDLILKLEGRMNQHGHQICLQLTPVEFFTKQHQPMLNKYLKGIRN